MVSLADIRAAAQRIGGHVIRTPLVYSPSISALAGAHVYLKLETLQKAGSFKVRGATNKILVNIAAVREHGVVVASAGNHVYVLTDAPQLYIFTLSLMLEVLDKAMLFSILC